MGSLHFAAFMAGSSLLRIVLCITIIAWHSSEGKAGGEETEVHEAAYQQVSNDDDQKPSRNIRSTKSKKTKSGKPDRKTKGKRGSARREKIKNKTKMRKQNKKRNSKSKNNKAKAKQDQKRKTKNRKTDNRKTKQTTVSCPTSAVSSKCLENAMFSLAYEKNQVTNYIKQAKRLDNHQNISSNKLTKSDEFKSAAKHMLWAIGGNLSDPKCGEDTNDTTRMERQKRDLTSSIANYYKLFNCSESIKEACDLTLKNETYSHDDHSENMTLCRTYKTDFIKVSKECQSSKDQANATLQCDCWARAAKDVTEIKKLKCETKDKQKFVTKHKNDCIKAFGKCKKMEDDAIDLIHKCMHDHSNDFINQTAEGLHAAAEKAGRAAFQQRLAALDISF